MTLIHSDKRERLVVSFFSMFREREREREREATPVLLVSDSQSSGDSSRVVASQLYNIRNRLLGFSGEHTLNCSQKMSSIAKDDFPMLGVFLLQSSEFINVHRSYKSWGITVLSEPTGG